MPDRIADARRRVPAGDFRVGLWRTDGVGARVAAAASPWRQPDGSYRFENRFKYRVLEP